MELGWVVSFVEAPKAFHHDFSLPLVSSVERRFYLNPRQHVNTILRVFRSHAWQAKPSSVRQCRIKFSEQGLFGV